MRPVINRPSTCTTATAGPRSEPAVLPSTPKTSIWGLDGASGAVASGVVVSGTVTSGVVGVGWLGAGSTATGTAGCFFTCPGGRSLPCQPIF